MKSKLVCGIGINDAYYNVTIKENGKTIWKCPYYGRWKDMIERCYSTKRLERQPTYKGCSVCKEWLSFSNFRKWMVNQDWEDKSLDKDVLINGNKVYGPDSCVFITHKTNMFLTDSGKTRGKYPIGVCYNKSSRMYQATIQENLKPRNLGLYSTPEEAHSRWKFEKNKQAILLAYEQTDQRVAKSLIERFK